MKKSLGLLNAYYCRWNNLGAFYLIKSLQSGPGEKNHQKQNLILF